jgi:hypothetical protein
MRGVDSSGVADDKSVDFDDSVTNSVVVEPEATSRVAFARVQKTPINALLG